MLARLNKYNILIEMSDMQTPRKPGFKQRMKDRFAKHGATLKKHVSALKQGAVSQKYDMKTIISSVVTFTFAIMMIVIGAILVADEKLIDKNIPEKSSQFNYGMGVTFCLLGSLVVVYCLFLFTKHLLHR